MLVHASVQEYSVCYIFVFADDDLDQCQTSIVAFFRKYVVVYSHIISIVWENFKYESSYLVWFLFGFGGKNPMMDVHRRRFAPTSQVLSTGAYLKQAAQMQP
jgi:hypothetical protein